MRRTALLATGLLLATLAATTGCGSSTSPATSRSTPRGTTTSRRPSSTSRRRPGSTVDFIYGDDAELLERLKAEGDDTPADVFMTVDAGNLWNAAEQGELAAVDSPGARRGRPEQYRDSQDRWFGLALRARTVAYNPDTVDPAEFDTEDTYAGLADPKWQGRLCMRDSTEAYTQSLVASLIDLHGREGALEIVQGWVDNDVDDHEQRHPAARGHRRRRLRRGDRQPLLLRPRARREPRPEREAVLGQPGRRRHPREPLGRRGRGGLRRPAEAQQLLEWLATDGQDAFVGGNHEYPVNPDVEPDDVVAGFGDFKPMAIDAEAYGSLNAEATDLLAEAGYE